MIEDRKQDEPLNNNDEEEKGDYNASNDALRSKIFSV